MSSCLLIDELRQASTDASLPSCSAVVLIPLPHPHSQSPQSDIELLTLLMNYGQAV